MFGVPLVGWEIVVLAVGALLICVTATSMAMESAALFVPAFLVGFPLVLPGFPTVGVNEAIGLTLVVMFFGQTSANVGYWLRDQIDFALAFRLLVWTVPLAVVGRILSYLLPEMFLLAGFSILLLGLAVVVASHAAESHPDDQQVASRLSRRRDQLSMSGGGAVTGLVGLGMGEVSNTVLSKNGLEIHRAIGTSTLVLYLTVLAATVTNLAVVRYGEAMGVDPSIPWGIALIVAPTVVVGGQIGSFLNSRLPEWVIVRVLVGLYVLVAAVTLLRAIG